MKLLLSLFALTILFSNVETGVQKSSEAKPAKTCQVSKKCPIKLCPKNDQICIKKYFQSHAKCLTKICHKKSDKLPLENFIHYTPVVNGTITHNSTLTGLNSGEVVDFIIDKTNSIAVLSIEYTNINITGVADFTYYQSCREPNTVRSSTSELYPRLIITTYFYDIENLSLGNSYSVANVTVLPTFALDPCLTNSDDPEIQTFYNAFLDNVGAVVQEAFQTRSPYIQKYFISENICNHIKKDKKLFTMKL